MNIGGRDPQPLEQNLIIRDLFGRESNDLAQALGLSNSFLLGRKELALDQPVM